jgi:hypothetical protein
LNILSLIEKYSKYSTNGPLLLIILPYYLLYNERVSSYLTSLSPRFTDPSKVAYSYTALFTLTIILAAIILTIRFGFNVWLNMDKSRIFGLVMLEICIVAFWPVVILLIGSSFIQIPDAMSVGLNKVQVAQNACNYILGLVTTALILSNLIHLFGMATIRKKSDVAQPG